MAGASLALLALACAPAAAVRVRGYSGDRQELAQSVAALWPLPDADWHFSQKATGIEGGCAESFEEEEGLSLDRQASRSTTNDPIRKQGFGNNTIGNPKIIYFNGVYGLVPSKGIVSECPALCEVTQDIEMISSADAILWNAGGYNHWTDPAKTKPPGQKWIFTAFFEPPNRQDYFEYIKRAETSRLDKNRLVDWTMTFHPKSDVLWPVARLVPIEGWNPGMDLPTQAETFRARQASVAAAQEDIERNLTALKADLSMPRPKILLAMVSNCVGERMELLKDLQSFLPPGTMDIMGKCGLKPPCPTRNESDACHQELFKQYKFFAAFENKRIEGYITEKLFRGLLEGMVPLAVGGRTKADYEALGVPPDAFVHVDDFRNTKDLADYLVNLDDVAYLKFFSWRKYLRVATTMETRKYSYCRVCKELYKDERDQIPSREGFGNLVDWWFEQYKGQYVTLELSSSTNLNANLTDANLTGVNGTSWNFTANSTASNLTTADGASWMFTANATGANLTAANSTSWNFNANFTASELMPAPTRPGPSSPTPR